MEVSVHPRLGDSVVELTKLGQQKGIDPFSWAIRLTSSLDSMGVSLPSVEVANALVSYICWDNNVPITWKFLDQALSLNIVPPMLVLALLSKRVIPSRSSQSVAYRLYLELLKRHVFSLKSQINVPNFEMVMKSVDSTLCLSNAFDVPVTERGILVVEFIFYIVFQLLESSLEDEGLLIEYAFEPNSKWANNNNKLQEMEINDKLILKNANTVMSIEIIGELLRNKVTSRILYLARRHMPTHWENFVKRLRLLGSKSTALRSSKTISPEALVQLTSDTRIVLSRECKMSSLQKFHAVMAFGHSSSAGFCHGTSHSAMWLPLDLALEDSMDGYQVDASSAIERITGLVKTLQAINNTSWHDTFLGLWIAALRFIQRERNPIEGPVPHLDTRLCLLLCITTLVVADLIDESDECGPSDESEVPRKRRNDLVSSLQTLGDYHALLTPPQSIASPANLASAKAMLFISGIGVGSSYFECLNMRDTPINCLGNMRHLIVEACIARNLLDTSAYFWPGYVNGRIGQIPQGLPSQVPGWSSFLKGATLTPLMINTLVSNPASSLAELEKIFDIAINGSNDERISAATILCGASLIRGWNIQEHTANFIIRLLSPPVPVDYSGIESHLMGYAPMLNELIVGIASVDCVQIFSLLGLVPQLACSLMPICEVFGSSLPTADEAISSHAIFSNAFILLLKLWRFNHPPLEHGVGDVPTVGSHLTPEYLLALRNSHLGDRSRTRLSAIASSSSAEPVFVDSFPKLKSWYRQHLACIASTLSGLVHGTPVHRIVDELLGMMFRKINSGGRRGGGGGSSNSTSSGGSSGGPGNDDGSGSFGRPRLPAWDILEAVPFVVDAALTACAHGTLYPRELATGLKDLADFLPASLAGIVSYFSAEVSRGIWKPAFMNGTDWPSPASNLSNVEEQIKRILSATGLDISSLSAGIRSAPATLPLPLAAFVSLTITYKIDKASEHFLNLAGPALESLAAGCPWPCMPIVAALWTLKAKRWTDFLVFSASRTVFLHSRHAVVQLVRSCFSAALAFPTATAGSVSGSGGGVGSLLGHGLGSPVAPGILYLRVYRSMRDIVFVTEEVVAILMESVREIASGSGRVGLAGALTRVKLAASLAASLVWLTGGLVLVQSLLKETLPSWFISVSGSGSGSGMGAMLGGYALAYFTVLCGAFAWGVDSSTSASRRRPKVLRTHLEFLASALERKVALGCGCATWRAYVSGFVSLVVGSVPGWVVEADADVVGRLGWGLRRWGEPELALALLGVCSMGPAAELIIEIGP